MDGIAKAVVDMPKTGSMQTVSTLSTNLPLPAGNHTIRLEVLNGTFNFYQLLQ